ncbi:1-aminocyclopropane-1-carboxylate oxidase homolog 4-like [Corylus avellana]|uniref:1-aminocyclopropane-1-carboxylate oxidase homolog 4-like n=1 Tax=Corylus avellana TaxID=13451 RepID=UPI001E1F5568|nr:1-aminocyclopropane-1-carboxylate oxidase homolog 4-like [Corylus avellana]
MSAFGNSVLFQTRFGREIMNPRGSEGRNPSPKTTTVTCATQNYDRAKEVKRFDDSKVGVKGLVDSGITTIPRFFVHPPETLSDLKPGSEVRSGSDLVIPAIDLSGVDSDARRSVIVDEIRRASSSFGFFQIVNHGVPLGVLDRTMASIKGFHEQPTEMKERFYRREIGTGVSYMSNVDLYHSKAASWRDTIQIRLGPKVVDEDEIPEICRKEVIEWDREIKRLGELLVGLLCEGLGVEAKRLNEMTCLEGRVMVGHYYPNCPQPDLTVGLAYHTDPGVLTVVQQDHVGGLQVKHDGVWLDVKPVPGALVINIGDLLQIISNEEYKSAEHRVLANSKNEPRVSLAVFFNPSSREDLYGPLPELISPEKPAIYRQFTLTDFMTRFFKKELDGKSLTNYYKL